jgi:hypothetical protein
MININRKKKQEEIWKFWKSKPWERREKEEEKEKRGKDKGNRRELEEISLKVRFRLLNV